MFFCDIECVIVKIYLKNTYLNIINMYIPPNKILAKNIFDQFLVDSKTILVGDLNGKSCMWGSGDPTNVDGCWKIL